MKRTALHRRTPLRRVSPRRSGEIRLYHLRRAQFLRDHPFCQVWLCEHGIDERHAISARGWVRTNRARPLIQAPRSDTIHHRNKRRGSRLVNERHWMAVSWASHQTIETDRHWARERGYLMAF